ncbi:hypothetical protein OZD68_03985 [Wolbachia endosymbiont of Drosophila bicornuta]|nr:MULTISPECIES: hypothetical protein [Wolbachia]MDE5056735.1 hypothetical protein [Wolbachia endosymbiont of Drosophila bicornuta]
MNRALFIASNFNLKYAKVEHLLLALTKYVDVNYVLSRCIALFTIIRTDHNMLLLYHSHKHISYPIRTIARSAIISEPMKSSVWITFYQDAILRLMIIIII